MNIIRLEIDNNPKNMSASFRRTLIWAAKANLAVWAANAVIYIVLYFLHHGLSIFSFFSLIALFEAGVFLLVGGALAFLGSASSQKIKGQILKSSDSKSDDSWSIEKLKSSEKSANKYLLLAAVLFVECLIVSIL